MVQQQLTGQFLEDGCEVNFKQMLVENSKFGESSEKTAMAARLFDNITRAREACEGIVFPTVRSIWKADPKRANKFRKSANPNVSRGDF